MSIETARHFLLWCSVLNYLFLLVWVVFATLGRSTAMKLKARFFHISDEQFDLLNVYGITAYKSAIFLFNIVPCIALYLV